MESSGFPRSGEETSTVWAQNPIAVRLWILRKPALGSDEPTSIQESSRSCPPAGSRVEAASLRKRGNQQAT